MNEGQHIVLIRTPTVLPVTAVTAQHGVPSLALAYLGAALKRASHRVTYIDSVGERLGQTRSFGEKGLQLSGLLIPEILERIPQDSDIIGVSCLFSNDWIYARRILEAIRVSFPRAKLIVGGEHVTGDYETVLSSCPFVSCCVLGEGEQTIVEVVNSLSSTTDLNSVAGVAFLKDGQIVKSAPRKRISDPDEIAPPDWESVPLGRYLDAGLGMAIKGLRTMPMLGSRGCPYRCTFCSAPKMWNAAWKPRRDIENIVAEAKRYVEKYRVEHLEFYDMSPSIDRDWLEKFSEAIGTLGLTWNFPSGMRSESLSPELLAKMKKSGLYKMTFPIETTSPHLIKALKKNTKPEKMLPLVKAAVREGMITKANFIWGVPHQRLRDILTDCWFLVRLAWAGMHDVTCFAFVPYPGSELHDELVRTGKIVKDQDYERFLAFNVYNNPLKMKSWSAHIKDRHLTYLSFSGMALFYSTQFLFYPSRLPALFKSLWTNKAVTMLELALVGLKKRVVTA
ncbi:MAG: radical SAM protein [Bdellovibrionia bacterium]